MDGRAQYQAYVEAVFDADDVLHRGTGEQWEMVERRIALLQGVVCEGRTLVSDCVKSKRSNHSLATA